MSLFSSKIKLAETDFFVGATDYHSHILPSVDDGFKSVDQTLELLSYYEQLFIKRVVLTPHIGIDYKHIVASHSDIFDQIKQLYTGSVQLHLAAEYMLDADFEGYITSGLRPIFDNRVLVESSCVAPPFNMDEQLYQLSSLSYTPVIAHPERYLYMARRDYDRLKNRGYEFQLNLLSLAGAYGKGVRESALYMLDSDMYELYGSDIHDIATYRRAISRIKLSARHIDRLMELKRAQNNRQL